MYKNFKIFYVILCAIEENIISYSYGLELLKNKIITSEYLIQNKTIKKDQYFCNSKATSTNF